jgi:hypothetical protein
LPDTSTSRALPISIVDVASAPDPGFAIATPTDSQIVDIADIDRRVRVLALGGGEERSHDGKGVALKIPEVRAVDGADTDRGVFAFARVGLDLDAAHDDGGVRFGLGVGSVGRGEQGQGGDGQAIDWHWSAPSDWD